MTGQHFKTVILGSGPAGCTAAIYAARANLDPVLIHGVQPGGQLMITTEVENYPGYADPVQGPWMMEQMHKQAENCGTKTVYDYVGKVDLSKRPFTLFGDSGTYTTDCLIIATGAQAKWLGIPSEEAFMGKGVSACATCDGAFFRNQDVLVVGGGNTALEEAMYLAKICKKVTVVHRRDQFRGEKILQDRLMKTDNIEVVWDTVLEEVTGDDMGVSGARLKNVKTDTISTVDVTGVFIAIGHKPNTEVFADWLPLDDHGYIDLPRGVVETPIPGVFACGDVVDDTYRQAVTAAGLGCMAALDAVRYFESLDDDVNANAPAA